MRSAALCGAILIVGAILTLWYVALVISAVVAAIPHWPPPQSWLTNGWPTGEALFWQSWIKEYALWAVMPGVTLGQGITLIYREKLKVV